MAMTDREPYVRALALLLDIAQNGVGTGQGPTRELTV